VLVGSRHTALSLWSAIDDPALAPRTRLGPPGVDVERFAPRSREAASAGLRALVERLRGADAPQPQDPASAFSRDARAAADALERVGGDDAPLVAFVGKLIVSKGVDLLLAAWPLVLEQEPAARLALVGFGAFRAPLERLCAAFAAGDLEQARQIALAGRSLEDASVQPRPLAHLLAFLDSLVGAERERYLRAAREMRERVAFVGRLEHDELAELLPACRALVVPSTFPEAFGMVAVEAAACAVLPISAAHSGLAEVSEALAASVAELDPWQLSFAVDHTAVRAIAARVLAWLQSDPDRRSRVGAELVRAVRERWSWQSVARGVLAAGGGEIGSLQAP
jgi:glycosyltransferase involved in cell wall biosynthesis